MFAFKVVCFVYCCMCVSGSVLMCDYIKIYTSLIKLFTTTVLSTNEQFKRRLKGWLFDCAYGASDRR